MPAFPHSGGTDRCGGHNDSKRGGYHVHNRSKYCACYPSKCSGQATKTPTSTTTEKSATRKSTVDANQTVYATKTGKKYHRSGCRYLSSSKVPLTLKDAAGRYSPCSVCGPPVLGSPGSSSSSATSSSKSKSPADSTATVYVTKSGSKYHKAGCRYLSKSQIAITIKKARTRYSPCSVCKPP